MIASRPLTSVPCDPPAGPAVGGGVRRGGGSRDGDLPRARRRVSARAGVWNPECGDALEGVSQCAHGRFGFGEMSFNGIETRYGVCFILIKQ